MRTLGAARDIEEEDLGKVILVAAFDGALAQARQQRLGELG